MSIVLVLAVVRLAKAAGEGWEREDYPVFVPLYLKFPIVANPSCRVASGDHAFPVDGARALMNVIREYLRNPFLVL
jgi:hypothetical protein